MIGHFKLMHVTVIWPTSRKREQGKKKGTITSIHKHLNLAKWSELDSPT